MWPEQQRPRNMDIRMCEACKDASFNREEKKPTSWIGYRCQVCELYLGGAYFDYCEFFKEGYESFLDSSGIKRTCEMCKLQ